VVVLRLSHRFFGGRLLALNKKSGGIRPITIGVILRRLASKCANSFGTSQLRSYFYLHQLGIGTPGGCEAAVHSACRYMEALPPDDVMVKLDFSNVFNTHRREMLLSVYNRVPELYVYCRSAYSQSCSLYFGLYIVLSEEGAQQGDSIGPLLFCNMIHPVLSSLQASLKLGYLDDDNLGGTVKTVASDVADDLLFTYSLIYLLIYLHLTATNFVWRRVTKPRGRFTTVLLYTTQCRVSTPFKHGPIRV